MAFCWLNSVNWSSAMHGTNNIKSTFETPFLGEAALLAQRFLVSTDYNTIK
jgi:hypothetical protein